jgi:two-component system phosphate regulon sensor histidine kinase PhoR
VLSNWTIELKALIFIVVLSTLIGLFFGNPLMGAFIGVFVYSLWNILQMSRLEEWLQNQDLKSMPHSSGLWGKLFDSIYRQEKRQREAKQRLQSIIDRIQESTAAIQDGVIMVDNKGNLEWWNRSSETLLGFRYPDDGGQHITNLIRDPDFIDLFTSGHYDSPLIIHSPLNFHMKLELYITPFGNDDRLITARDVTHIEHLEHMRRDFIANVSHELKTPLTVIIGYLETLIDYAEEENPRTLRMFNQMQAQAVRMQDLVKDLLILTRLETTEVQLETKPVNLKMLLQQVAEDARIFAKGSHAISLVMDNNLHMQGCYDELLSAFGNLAINAVKYTPEGSSVEIFCHKDNTGIYVSFKDNGQGIDQKHLPHLTERFYRVDPSRKADTGGTGLGLAITKHIVIRHNGQLIIESQINKGSEFRCEFPLSMLSRKDSEQEQL